MVFQDYTSFDHRTVLDNITFGLECQGVRRAAARRARPRVDRARGAERAADADKYPHELSGGMRQRVAIARTLILRPRIILMDEPFGALDPQTRMDMQDLLVALWREVQATVFFVTHSIEEAVFLGDRVYVMGRSPGTILQELEVEPADRPARLMQREPRFQETVNYIRDLICAWKKRTARNSAFGKYLKVAFLNHWNLLAFLGGFGLRPAERLRRRAAAAWCWRARSPTIGLLGSHPKFQSYVDAQAAKIGPRRNLAGQPAGRGPYPAQPAAGLAATFPDAPQPVPGTSPDRFGVEASRDGRRRRPLGSVPGDRPGPAACGSTCDCSTRSTRCRSFCRRPARTRFSRRSTSWKSRSANCRPTRRIRAASGCCAALQDNLETSRSRLANWKKANENHQLIDLEIDRLENKIRSLSEMAVNRQEPEFITNEVDHVASSLLDTERTMNELQFATGLNGGGQRTARAVARQGNAGPEMTFAATVDKGLSRFSRRGERCGASGLDRRENGTVPLAPALRGTEFPIRPVLANGQFRRRYPPAASQKGTGTVAGDDVSRRRT